MIKQIKDWFNLTPQSVEPQRQKYDSKTEIKGYKTIEESSGEKKYVLSYDDGIKVFRSFPTTGTVEDLVEEVLNQGFQIPSSESAVDLIYAPYALRSIDRSKSIPTDHLRTNDESFRGGILLFNRNLWTPKGVYVKQIRNLADSRNPLSINELEESLENDYELSGEVVISRDGYIRFAPKSSYEARHLTRSHPWERNEAHACDIKDCDQNITNDGFVIASVGVDGARKLNLMARKRMSKYNNLGHPEFFVHRYNVKNGEENIETFTSLHYFSPEFITDHGKYLFSGVIDKSNTSNKRMFAEYK